MLTVSEREVKTHHKVKCRPQVVGLNGYNSRSSCQTADRTAARFHRLTSDLPVMQSIT